MSGWVVCAVVGWGLPAGGLCLPAVGMQSLTAGRYLPVSGRWLPVGGIAPAAILFGWLREIPYFYVTKIGGMGYRSFLRMGMAMGFACACLYGEAQNLVPNPSFEQNYACPNMQCQAYRVVDWNSFGYTPDYFHSCGNLIGGYGVPQNNFCYQWPFEGDGYVGVIAHSSMTDVREYVGTQLLSPLTAGVSYHVSFRTCFSDNPSAQLATNKLGARFSTRSYAIDTTVLCNAITYLVPDNRAHIYTDSIITDTANWTLISGTVVADSAYQYLIIGCFFDDANVDTLTVASCCNSSSYYVIDSVVVVPDSVLVGVEDNRSALVRIMPNPTTGLLYIKTAGVEQLEKIILRDFSGRIVHINSTGNRIDITRLPPSLYMVEIRTDRQTTFHKILKTNER